MGLIKKGDTKSFRRHAGDLLVLSDGINMSCELRRLEETGQTIYRNTEALTGCSYSDNL